ncbi:MAG: HDOD domain-containing protein [Azoarcus sp.]|nr:HDOD domain-containing protein [Azoarcus sp.]
MYSAQELVANIETLAALPTVYYRVRDQLESPNASIGDIARLLENDPSLTSGVLRLVNSAFFGFSRRIESVARAIPILGLRQTHELVLAISVSNVFDGIRPQYMDMKRYWQGCMTTALAARELAQLTYSTSSERLFIIGLLADIGHLVMYQTVPDLAIEAQTIADAGAGPLYEAERRVVGCDFAEVGAALTDNWSLPTNFAEIIGAQNAPKLAGEYALDAALLHVSLVVSTAVCHDEPSEQALARIDPRILSAFGIEADNFSLIREIVEANLDSCTATFFPKTAR